METIGKYEVVGEIARGGSGVVYRARDPAIGRDVAIKVLLTRAADAGDHARKRFAREASALGRLRHPGIVPLFDVGEQDGRPFLVLPLIEGETLRARLEREGPLPECEAAELLQAVAEALQHAHDHGLIHRDVKPANVLIDREERPALTDFGLVKDLGASLSKTRLTVEGRFMGTPGYWAPEQARGEVAGCGPRTDVYGLGATLYAALTGAPPQAGSTLVEYLEAADREVRPPSSRRKGISPGLDAICAKCLARDPAARYASAREVAEDLSRFSAGQQVEPARPRGVALRTRYIVAASALVVAAVTALGVIASRRSAARERLARAEELLSRSVGSTPEALAAARGRLAEARALAAGDPELASRIEAREAVVRLWGRLAEARAVVDLRERAERLREIRSAAGATVDSELASALDHEVFVALRRVLQVRRRKHLRLPDLPRSRELFAVVRTLEAALTSAGPSDATRVAVRARILTQTEVLVARSRSGESFEPLLGALSKLLSEIPRDRVELASEVRLELGLMHARAGRFRHALRVLEPLFEEQGPYARVARAEAVTLVAMSHDQSVDVGELIRRVVSEGVEDPWLHVVRQRQAIRKKDVAMKRAAERALVSRYPTYWFSALTRGDLALASRDARAARAAYDRAEVLSPRDARVWWWKAASFGAALRFAAFLPREQAAQLKASRDRNMRLLRQVLPPGTEVPAPAWSNVR